MQPYQEAAEERKRQGQLPVNIAKGAASLGTSFAGGVAGAAAAGIGGKILPFLSKYIPQDLAIKGMSKVEPRIGKFINKAMSEGYDFDEVKDFIGQKFEESQEKTAAKDNRNIIEQYDPELHTYILQKMKKGKSHLEAGRKALGHGRFKRAIDKITKDHKQNWTSILESVYGKQMAPKEQPPQQQQQPGQDNSALLAILQKLHSATGAQ
jgi:hypothetical protein